MKISIRKVTKLVLVGELPKSLNGEVDIVLKCWFRSVEKPLMQNEDDDIGEIINVEVSDGIARIK